MGLTPTLHPTDTEPMRASLVTSTSLKGETVLCYVCHNQVSKPKVLEISPSSHVLPLHDVCAKNLRMLVKLLETADTTVTHKAPVRGKGKHSQVPNGRPRKPVTILEWLVFTQFQRELRLNQEVKTLLRSASLK